MSAPGPLPCDVESIQSVVEAAELVFCVVASCSANLMDVDAGDLVCIDAVLASHIEVMAMTVVRMASLPCRTLEDVQIKRKTLEVASQFVGLLIDQKEIK